MGFWFHSNGAFPDHSRSAHVTGKSARMDINDTHPVTKTPVASLRRRSIMNSQQRIGQVSTMTARRFFLLFVVLAAASITVPAQADYRHRHSSVRIGVGIDPFWGYWTIPPPVYYPQPVIIERPAPPVVYIERPSTPPPAPAPTPPASSASSAPSAAYSASAPTNTPMGGDVPPSASSGQYWYFCPSSNGYYPYVKECPQGWQQVPAQPADLERR